MYEMGFPLFSVIQESFELIVHESLIGVCAYSKLDNSPAFQFQNKEYGESLESFIYDCGFRIADCGFSTEHCFFASYSSSMNTEDFKNRTKTFALRVIRLTEAFEKGVQGNLGFGDCLFIVYRIA